MKKYLLFLVTSIFMSNTITAQNFEWVKSLSHEDNGKSISNIVNDSDGNSYIIGHFSGTIDFDPSENIFELSSPAGQYPFILKLDIDGNFIWVKTLNTNTNNGINIEIDASNNLIIIGRFSNSIDFDPGSGIHTLTALSPNNLDLYILKLNSDGEFLWVKQTESINATAFTTDSENNIIITGYFSYTKYFMHPSTTLTASGTDMFILKLNEQGNFLWVKEYGSSNQSYFYPTDLVSDSEKNIIITGDSKTANGSNIYLCKYSPGGNYIEGNSMGGDDDDKSYSITIDNSDNVFITGTFEGTVMLGVLGGGYHQFDSKGFTDAFILKYNFTTHEEWVVQLGSTKHEYGYTIDTDDDGNIFCTGDFRSLLYFESDNTTITINTSEPTPYICKLNSMGNFEWATKLEGIKNRMNVSVYDKSIFLTGNFEGTIDFNPDENNSTILESTGVPDNFIMKINTSKLTTNIKNNNPLNKLIIENPSRGKFKIDLSSSYLTNLKIYNTSGQEYFPTFKNDNLLEFDLDKGIYFLTEIQNSTVINTRKILIQ